MMKNMLCDSLLNPFMGLDGSAFSEEALKRYLDDWGVAKCSVCVLNDLFE